MQPKRKISDRPRLFRRRTDLRKNTRSAAARSGTVPEEMAADVFRRVFDSVYDGILLHAPDGSILDMNEQFLAMYRVGREQLLSMRIADISAEANPLNDLPLIWARVMAGEKQLFAWKAKRPVDGSTFDVEVFLNRIEMREQPLILATVRDISDRKRLEEALVQSEERYKLLFDKSPLPKWVFDLGTFSIVEVNDEAVKHYGYSKEEFAGLPIAEIRTPEEYQQLTEWVKSCCGRGEKFEGHVQTKHRKKNGEVIDVDIHYTEIIYKGRRAGLGVIIDITERKKAEDVIKRSQALLAEAEKLSHTGAWEWDIVADRWTFSEEWQKIHGVIEHKLSPAELIAIAHPDDRRAIQQAFDDLQAGIRPYEIEHRIIRQDNGAVRVVRASGQFVRNREGTVIKAYGFVQDITERKRTEEQLQASRRLLETVVDHIPAGVNIIRGSDLRLQLANPAYEAIAPGKAMLGRTLSELWPETGRDFVELCRRVLATGESYHADDEPMTIRRTPDGPLEQAYFSWSLDRVPLPDHDGWGILNTVWETTGRKQAENRIRRLFDSGIIGIIYWNMKGEIIDANDKFLDIMGYTRQDLHEGRMNWSEMTPPEYGDADERALEDLRATGVDTPYEKEYIRKDGRRVPIIIGAALFDEIGQDGVAYVLDITDRKRAEEELRRTVEELQRSNSELQQFAYVASHDLQEPLRTVGSYVELLAMKYRGKLDATADRYIAYAVEGANRMSALINDLLAYSRVGTRGGEFLDVDMNTVYQGAIANLRKAVRENQAAITADRLPSIRGDESQLRQLMQNLLANAIKFRKPDTPPRIHVASERTGQSWILSITDNGIGIEPRFFDRIFTIFQRLHTREEYPGTGVGLAICRRIVERHGGRIWVESKPGEGSTFFFTLKAG